MNPEQLRALLLEVAEGKTEVTAAVEALRTLPYRDLGFANVDHHRALRQGLPEVILAESKSAAQIASIASALIEAEQNVLVTRLAVEKAPGVLTLEPRLSYRSESETASYEHALVSVALDSPVLVVTAGTSDLRVAEEALETLRMCGVPGQLLADVGVAGIHRILGRMERLSRAPALIVVAGMEGALSSVIGGLVAAPVVAVPTSIGYGAAFGGVAALLGMLTSCAAGVTVVNIDNGFGAAIAVFRMLSLRARQLGAQVAGAQGEEESHDQQDG